MVSILNTINSSLREYSSRQYKYATMTDITVTNFKKKKNKQINYEH